MPGSVGRALFGEDANEESQSPDKNRLPTPIAVPDSLLQLQEETEPQAADGESLEDAASRSPMACIEIRTFKMLNLVREHACNNIGASEKDEDSQGNTVKAITTVCKPNTFGCGSAISSQRNSHQGFSSPALIHMATH